MCGYCGGPLTRTNAGDYRCEPCQPGLAAIVTPADWAAFIRSRGMVKAGRVLTEAAATSGPQQDSLW